MLRVVNLDIDEILDLYFPIFLDMVSYYNDPEGYLNPVLSDNELEDKKRSIEEGLNRLRTN